jgi:methylglyoxal synthase
MRTKVALIAHDRRKPEMIALCRDYQEMLSQEELVATKGTGGLIEELTGLHVATVNSGDKGGDLQIGSMIAGDQIKAVVFLGDPLTARPHEPGINAVLKICDVNDVPLATNISTARLILGHLKDLQDIKQPPATQTPL